jgi:hypothetical protein
MFVRELTPSGRRSLLRTCAEFLTKETIPLLSKKQQAFGFVAMKKNN